MPNFYSPTGNYEVWSEKPDGYFTAEEWLAAHPIEETVPDLETVRESALAEIKQKLAGTDPKQAEWLDGDLTDEEYEPIRLQRKHWRVLYDTVETATEISQITAVWPEVS